jgi:hypothetical protein
MENAPQNGGKLQVNWATAVDWALVNGLIDDYWREMLSAPTGIDTAPIYMRHLERLGHIKNLLPSAEQQSHFETAIQVTREAIERELQIDALGVMTRLGVAVTPVPKTVEPAPATPPQNEVDWTLAQRMVDDYYRDLFTAKIKLDTFDAEERFNKRVYAMKSDAFTATVNELLQITTEEVKKDRPSVERRLGVAMQPWQRQTGRSNSGMGATIAKDVGRTAVRFTVWEMLLRLFGR